MVPATNLEVNCVCQDSGQSMRRAAGVYSLEVDRLEATVVPATAGTMFRSIFQKGSRAVGVIERASNLGLTVLSLESVRNGVISIGLLSHHDAPTPSPG